MFAKYKKLIISQVCAVLAVSALILAWLRHAQTGSWSEQTTASFLFFAVLLFAAEIRFILLWVKDKKAGLI